MSILLALLERFAHLLPQTLRVGIAMFIADRLLRALDAKRVPLPLIAKTEIRLQRLLVAFSLMRWRWLNGLPEGKAPCARIGHLAHDRANLRTRLIELWQAFSDLDHFIAVWRAARLRIAWKQFTRTPRRFTSLLAANLRAAFRVCALRRTPAPRRALELSG